MVYFKSLKPAILLATTLLGMTSFSHAMEETAKDQDDKLGVLGNRTPKEAEDNVKRETRKAQKNVKREGKKAEKQGKKTLKKVFK